MPVSVAANLSLLRADLVAAERELQDLRERIADTSDFSEQTKLQKAERAQQDRLEALRRTLAAAEAEAAVKAQADAEATALRWRTELHAEAVAELKDAENSVLDALRQCRSAFDKWQALHLEWEARRVDLGSPEPGLPRCASSLLDWLRPSPFDAGARERSALVR